MKKITLITLLLCLIVSITGIAQNENVAPRKMDRKELVKGKFEKEPKLKKDLKKTTFQKRTKKKIDKTAVNKKMVKSTGTINEEDLQIILEEDFRYFTEGSEADPDATEISDIETQEIPEIYTLTPGWEGAGIFQAGGVAFIDIVEYNDGDYPGVLFTPYIDLSANSGNFTVKLRARSQNPEGDVLNVVWTYGEGEEDYDFDEIEITNTWAEYTVTGTLGSSRTYVEFWTEDNPCFIDDIEILQEETEPHIDAPEVLRPTNVTETGFTANWESVANATSYLLSVYSYEEEGSGSQGTPVSENFDGIKLVGTSNKIDTENPNYPAGWTIEVATGNRHVYNNSATYSSAPIALAFTDTGDKITTPLTTEPITSFSLWMMENIGSDQDVATSYFTIQTFNGTEWATSGTIDIIGLNGERVDISNKIPEGTLQVRLTFTKDVGNCGVDDVSYTYGGSRTTKDYLFQDRSVNATTYDVAGTTAGTQYYYTVKATDGTLTSAESDEMEVKEYNAELPAPVMLPATHVTNNGFTANWRSVEGANAYNFYTYLTHTAPAAETYQVAHEDFNTITDDIEPGIDDYLDEYTNRPDWEVFLPLYADGMVGIDNSYEDLTGVLYSPYYDLSANDGKFTVEITAQSTIGDELIVSNIDSDNTVINTERREFESATQTFTFEFTSDAPNTYIAIESTTATVTYIDDIKITKTLRANDAVILAYYYEGTEATSANVSTLDRMNGDSYSYGAGALYIPDNEDEDIIYSEFSELMQVENPPPTSIESAEINANIFVKDFLHVVLENSSLIEVYTVSGTLFTRVNGINGENLIRLPQGVYIVKIGDTAVKVIK